VLLLTNFTLTYYIVDVIFFFFQKQAPFLTAWHTLTFQDCKTWNRR